MGHECKEDSEPKQTQQEIRNKNDGKPIGERQVWIPKDIATLMKGVMDVEELRTKLTHNGLNEEDDYSGTQHQGSSVCPHSKQEDVDLAISELHNPAADSESGQAKEVILTVEDDEGEWTPVAPGKVARRGQNRILDYSTPRNTQTIPHDEEGQQKSSQTAAHSKKRDGNPLIPSDQ
ncbi:unnamed protein product [Amaranthus hypochondriacus]